MTDLRGGPRRGPSPGIAALILSLLVAAPLQAIEEPVPLTQEGIVGMSIKDANALAVVESIVINGRYNFVTKGKIEETVTVNLKQVSIQDALDAVTQTCGLEYRVQGRIITLYGKDADSSYTDTYKFQVASVGSQGGPGQIIRRLVEGGGDADVAAATAGTPAAGTDTGGGGGGGKGGRVIIDRMNNQLVVTAVPSTHRRISRLVSALDKVTEERGGRKARIFELRYISPDFFKKAVVFEIPGFQDSQILLFSDAGGGAAGAAAGGGATSLSTGDVEGNLKRVLVTESEENLARIENLLRAIDRSPRQVFLDVKILTVSQSDLNVFGNQLRLIAMKDQRATPVAEFFSNNTGSGGNPFKLKVGTLGPEQFELLSDFLEQNNRSNQLSNPKLTVVDGRSAQIKTVTREPYGETTVNQGVSQTQVKFIDVGITLNFVVAILPDNQVKLAVQPEISDSVRNETIGGNRVPVVAQTTAQTILLVKNLHTAIIGGILQNSKAKNFQTMPILGHLPLIGRLFHRHEDTGRSSQILITITTRIIDKGDFEITTKPKATEQGKMKYYFHNIDQIGKRLLFIDEVVEF